MYQTALPEMNLSSVTGFTIWKNCIVMIWRFRQPRLRQVYKPISWLSWNNQCTQTRPMDSSQFLSFIESITQLVLEAVRPVLGHCPVPWSSSTMVWIRGCWIFSGNLYKLVYINATTCNFSDYMTPAAFSTASLEQGPLGFPLLKSGIIGKPSVRHLFSTSDALIYEIALGQYMSIFDFMCLGILFLLKKHWLCV